MPPTDEIQDQSPTSLNAGFEQAFGIQSGADDGDKDDKGAADAEAAAKGAADAAGKGGQADGNHDDNASNAGAKPGEGSDGEGNKAPITISSWDDVLKHPELQAEANRWKDSASSTAVRTALERERGRLSQETRRTVEEEQFATYVESLTPEERARELSNDEEFATKYANYTASKAGAGQEVVARQAQIYSMATTIQTLNEMVEEANLPPEELAKLHPDNFREYSGVAGVVAYQKAVQAALLSKQVQDGINAQIETRWQAHLQENNAELDEKRGAALGGRGRNANPNPSIADLKKIPTNRGFEMAFGAS